MNLGKLFQRLSRGELSNLAMGMDGAGTILPSKKAAIVDYANDALVKLYGKFVLEEQEVLIEMNEWTTNYHLLPRFAVQFAPTSEEEDEPIRYILDLPKEKFKGNVLKILRVTDSNGNRLPLNDEECGDSLYTPQANVLQVPEPEAEKSLSVVYQSAHHELTGEPEQDIELPLILQEALRSYIAYKVYSNMNGETSVGRANEHYQMFESICSNVTENDLVNSSVSTTNTRFASRGFV